MDAQLIQAMGGMTLAERQRKFYATKTDEEKKELNRKKTEAARLRRQAKREEEAKVQAVVDAKRRDEEEARAEQDRKRVAELVEAKRLREETITPQGPSTRLKAAKLLVKHLGWSETLADIKMLPDSANPEKERVFPSQYLLITPDGTTAWWMEESMLQKGGATISEHKFHKKGRLWMEVKPPTHSPFTPPYTNAFYYLKWGTPQPMPSYEEWKESQETDTSWRAKDGTFLKPEAFYRDRYEEEKTMRSYYEYPIMFSPPKSK
jgi:hypothetical protein